MSAPTEAAPSGREYKLMCRKQDANWSNQRLTRRQVTFERIDVRDTMKRKPSKLKKKGKNNKNDKSAHDDEASSAALFSGLKMMKMKPDKSHQHISQDRNSSTIELLTLPVGVRVLVIFGVVVVHTK